jgi:UDP-2-acetamido-3-amino-2,3-dideoxy-glucuronate N-acetyltransferase
LSITEDPNHNLRYFAHPTATIDAGASIGDGTKIWHYCHVYKGAVIGKNCIIGQGCSIASTVVIGNNAKIQNGVSIYDGVKLDDGVFCGPHMIFTHVINPRALIEKKTEYRQTLVGKGATIGAGAIIVCGNSIGAFAMIGAGAVITKPVPPFALVYGNPARQHGWVGCCGTKLKFDADNRATGEDGNRYLLSQNAVTMECV